MNADIRFADLGLPAPLLQAVISAGYELPTPIQAACIPLLLVGHDLLGQAQTGTGKTAAFALPLLARVDMRIRKPQLLVLAPTRELAIQIAEAMQTYAHFLPDFHVLPIYGGQGFSHQLRQLKRGVQVVVGTPGRVMDHMRRGTLVLRDLQALVLDEADEMLRMGFIDDVTWILDNTPAGRQIALFSATMPSAIREVANRHLNDPQIVKIQDKTTTAAAIRQRYWIASGLHKLDALTRILETEAVNGVIIFVRTKTATVELAEKLAARGFACEALNGDIVQAQREKTVERLRRGQTDLLVATDVAARGLDVRRVSHVVNYDIPHDTESYVHRVGRTGRAGQPGEAILFVAPRERRMLRAIEKATGQPIESMEMPSVEVINQNRVARFKQRVIGVLGEDRDLSTFYQVVKAVESETDADPSQVAAALASMVQGDEPLLMTAPNAPRRTNQKSAAGDCRDGGQGHATQVRPHRKQGQDIDQRARPLKAFPEIEMERFRLAVGRRHGVKPGNIVGAIANEADLESRYIGHIEIFDDFSLVDLPAGMPKETYDELQRTWVCQRKLQIERWERPADVKQGAPLKGKRAVKGAVTSTPKSAALASTGKGGAKRAARK